MNQALNRMRRDRRLTGIEDAAELATEDAFGGEPGLTAALRALPLDRRCVITLRYGLDLTPTEIGEAGRVLLTGPAGRRVAEQQPRQP